MSIEGADFEVFAAGGQGFLEQFVGLVNFAFVQRQNGKACFGCTEERA